MISAGDSAGVVAPSSTDIIAGSVVTNSVVTILRPCNARAAAMVMVPDSSRAPDTTIRVPVQDSVQWFDCTVQSRSDSGENGRPARPPLPSSIFRAPR